jgi:MFS transporter, OFA family, oxalate/formate antiporter
MKNNRWLIAIMCTLLMIMLGSVYAWSFFQKLIVGQYGWTNSQVAWVFSTSIAFLGFAAAWGGINLSKFGARKLALMGIVLYFFGFITGSFAFSISNLTLLIIGFGVIGGSGLGLAYVTPVVTAAKWFPDRKGFITGMVVMGFGFGALIMSKIIAPLVMKATEGTLSFGFFYIGITILLLGLPAAFFVKEPPSGYVSENKIISETGEQTHNAGKAIFSLRFLFMWIMFFVNITAGIMFIGFQSPLMQDLMQKQDPALDPAALAGIGASLIAISSIFNGVGRFFWGSLSDKIGRVQSFRLILGSQVIAFVILSNVHNPYLFGALVCYILLCYGGGFGTMPSFVADVFTPRLMPVVYGCILTAWSMGGIAGPQIVAIMKDKFPEYAAQYSFITGAIFLVAGFLITFLLHNKPVEEIQ